MISTTPMTMNKPATSMTTTSLWSTTVSIISLFTLGGARTAWFGPHPSQRVSHDVDCVKRALLLSHLGENLPNGRRQRLRVVEQRLQLAQRARTDEGTGDTRIIAHPRERHVAR